MTTIVLLHGLMGSGASWRPVMRVLERELAVLAPDARGHGQPASDGRYGYDDHADDVEQILRDLDRPLLMGHSMGGLVATVVAARRRVVLRGLVLVDPTFLSPERQREVYASDVAEQHRRMLARSKDELVADIRARHPHRTLEIAELQAEARLQTSMAALDVLRPPNPDYRELVRAIDVPILLVIGDTSPVVTLEAARELCALQPRLSVAQIAGAGHGLPFDQPQQLGEVVLAWHNAPAE